MIKIGDMPSFGVGISRQIKREEIHGMKTVKARTKTGEDLEKGYILGNGEVIRSKEITRSDCDASGSPEEIIQTLVEGEIKSGNPELLKLEKKNANCMFGFKTDTVIALGLPPEENPETGFYVTTYTSKLGSKELPARVIIREKENKKEAFLLIGEERQPTWLGLQPHYEFFESDKETETENSGDDLKIEF